jgi:hypothetical protein
MFDLEILLIDEARISPAEPGSSDDARAAKGMVRASETASRPARNLAVITDISCNVILMMAVGGQPS